MRRVIPDSGHTVQRARAHLAASAHYPAGVDAADRAAVTHAAVARAARLAADEAAPPRRADDIAAVGMASPALERLLSLRRLRRADWTLILSVFGLSAIGLLMVFSVSQAIAPNDPWYWLRHQALMAALGLLALVVFARIDYHSWYRWRWVAPGALGVALALMTATLFYGLEVNGGQRWLGGSFGFFQPSEPAKLALILFLADWFARVGPGVRSVRRGLAPFAGATGALVALTLLQRDLGTTVVIIALAFAMYFTAGARLSHLIKLLGVGVLCLGGLALAVSYRRARLAAFLNPLPPGCRDPNSYQVCQGLLSLGSGGGLGAGLGASVQKAGYLPFPQSDSIYAVLGGELGLLGCALTIGLLIAVVWRGYGAGRRAPDTFGALLACGIATWFATQAAINIGSVVAAIPFTGVPLPFVSYGGAALVSELAAVGILLNIHAQGAPLRNAALARRLRRDDGTTTQRAGDHAANRLPQQRRRRPLAGMPLATSTLLWTARTRGEPASFARTRGEEQPSP